MSGAPRPLQPTTPTDARSAPPAGSSPSPDGPGVAPSGPEREAGTGATVHPGHVVERVRHVDGALRERLLDIWTAVVNGGGWVGFVPPVDRRDIEPALDAALQRVERGSDWLVVVRLPAPWPQDVAGFAFVVDNDRLLSEHWRWVLRVQIAPEHRATGLGSVLMAGVARIAKDAGLEMLLLTVRGGEGLEGFYARNGYREIARIPNAIRVAPGDDRDQVHLLHEL